jgi:hypothetical protein
VSTSLPAGGSDDDADEEAEKEREAAERKRASE